MPNRYLRESFIESENINAVSMGAELFWVHLLVNVDDWGRCEASPRLLRAKLFPLRLDRVKEADLDRWLTECESASLIRRYESGNKQYLQVIRWEKGRAANSKYPPHPAIENGALQPYTDADICLQPHTNENKCLQPQTDASSGEHLLTLENISPDSDSDSDSDSDADADTDADTDAGKTESAGKPAPAAKAPPQTDEEWLSSLSASPAYEGIDVRREFAKCTAWCATNRKQASRRRFINWLNRCEKPMAASGTVGLEDRFAKAW